MCCLLAQLCCCSAIDASTKLILRVILGHSASCHHVTTQASSARPYLCEQAILAVGRNYKFCVTTGSIARTVGIPAYSVEGVDRLTDLYHMLLKLCFTMPAENTSWEMSIHAMNLAFLCRNLSTLT